MGRGPFQGKLEHWAGSHDPWHQRGALHSRLNEQVPRDPPFILKHHKKVISYHSNQLWSNISLNLDPVLNNWHPEMAIRHPPAAPVLIIFRKMSSSSSSTHKNQESGCYGWKAEGDKLQNSWASWRVVDVESSISVVLFSIWLFLLACRLYPFDFFCSS
jgi:hypothetical protein